MQLLLINLDGSKSNQELGCGVTEHGATHVIQDLAFCGVVFLSNGISHCACAHKQGVPVVGAKKKDIYESCYFTY